MSFSSLVKRWFGKRQGAMRNSRPGPIQTRKKSGARKPVKLMLEILEDRLAPATLSYNGAMQELDFTAAAGETIAVTAPASNKIQIHTSDTITLGNGTGGGDFSGSGGSTVTISNVNLDNGNSGNRIYTFYVYLANQQNSPDALTFGLGASSGVQYVYIGAVATPPAPLVPPTDTNDAVTLTSTTTGILNVSAETIDVNGGASVPYQGQVTIAGTAGSQTIAMPGYGPGWKSLGLAPGDNITIGGMTGSGHIASISLDEDTLTLDSGSFIDNTYPNGTVNMVVADLSAPILTLTSVNSLQVQSTGLPYLGNVAINAAPPAGQPYATYPYVTGPDWGAYGYQPGDVVTISDPVPGFTVTTSGPGNTSDISTVPEALTQLQQNPNSGSYNYPVIDIDDNEASGLESFNNSTLSPVGLPGTGSPSGPNTSNITQFVVQATADVYIPGAGTYTFGTNSDDGDELIVGGTTVLEDDTTNGPSDTFGSDTFTSAGLYPIDLVYFNDTGPGDIQLYAASGNWTSFAGAKNSWELVGDTAAGGLSVTTVGNPSYTVANIAGDNLYLVDPNSSLLAGNYTGVTVAIAKNTFTPQITAANFLSLNVTGPGNTITGAVNTGDLAATTMNGNISLNVLGSANLETIDAGTANINLYAQGSIMSGNPVNGATVNLEAASVDLTTTGTGSSIGSSIFAPILTDIAELTAATNDGSVYIDDNGGSALTIDSVVADQDGQAPTVNDGQILYNSTPDQQPPIYAVGSSSVTIDSQGPIILNSVSATGDVTISGEYVLEGDAQTPDIIAPSVALTATGAANYEGQVTFADNSGGDTLALPGTGPTWTALGFVPGAAIVVSGASDTANDATFTIATGGISPDGYTLTLQQSYVLDPDTDLLVSVGDGMIGVQNISSSSTSSTSSLTATGAISLSAVGSFTATTTNGNIFVKLGGSVDSTAVSVDAGGTGNVAVTSQANFLTIDNITANGSNSGGGDVAVAMNSGALLEYPDSNGDPGIITGQNVSLMSQLSIGTSSSPLLTDASNGLTVSASATSPSSAAVYVENEATLAALGVTTYDGAVAIYQSNNKTTPLLSFSNNQLSTTGSAVVSFANTDDSDGTDDNIVVNGAIDASNITAGGQILAGTHALITGQIVVLSAGNGIGTPGTSINTDVAALDASTSTGNIEINQIALATAGSGATVNITTANGAITSVTLGAGSSSGYLANSMFLLMVTGGGGTGGLVEAATNSSGVITSIIALVAGGSGYTNTPGAATSVASAGSDATVNITTDKGAITSVTLGSGGSSYPANSILLLMVTGGGGTGGVVEAVTNSSGVITSMVLAANGGGYANMSGVATSAAFMLLSASTSNGNIVVSSSGGDDLILDGISTGSHGMATFTSDAAIDNTTSVSSAAASGNSASANSATLSGLATGTLSLSATNGIGTASNPLATSVTSLTAAGGGLFLKNNNSLTLTTSGAITGDVGISTIGDLALNLTNGDLGSTGNNVSLTATAGSLTTTAGSTGSIDADTLTISAEQIGDSAAYSPDGTASETNDTIPTDATTIDATADYGGVYISNSATSALTLTAGAVGPTPGGTPTNNIDISSQGGIVLLPQTSTLPGAGTTLIALYSPGGAVTLTAGTGGYIASTSDIVSGLTTSSLTTGMAVSGTGIPAGDTIQDVLNSTEIVLSEPATASGAVSLTFTPVITTTGNITGTTVSDLASTSSLTSGMPVSGLGIPAGDTILDSSGTITLTEPATFTETGITLTFYATTQSTTATGNTEGTSDTYFDVYTGTLTIGTSKLTTSGPLSGTDYGPLLTETNTAEVVVFAPIAITNSGPLQLTASILENGGTFTGSSITIGELGSQPLPINGNLTLESTGAIVFLDPNNSISASVDSSNNPYAITIEAGSVAALGNIATDNGDVTIVAAGNIGVGTVNAGSGTVTIASSGSIFNINGGTTLSITGGHTNLSQAQIQVFSQGQGPSTGTAQSSNLAQLELQAAQALATAAAASAQAGAEQTTAAAFQAELNSIQAAVANDSQTYQTDLQAENQADTLVAADGVQENYDTRVANGLNLAAAIAGVLSATLSPIADGLETFAAAEIEAAGPFLGPILFGATELAAKVISDISDAINFTSAVANLASAAELFTEYNDGLTLSNDSGTDETAHDSLDQAYAQYQADLDTQAAVAAAYNVAEQAATSDAIIAKQDQAVAQADSALVQAASVASTQASAPAPAGEAEATATAQPLTVNGGPLTVTGEAPSGSNVTNLTVSAAITIGYSISGITANGTTWTVTTTAASGLAANASVTISGVTPAGYDGTWTVTSASTLSAPYTFTIASTTSLGPAGFGGTAAAVPAGINFNGNGSPITVSANITAPGSVDLVEPETASGGDDLSVSPGATVASENSSVALAAGDNIDISSGATIQASTTIAITADTNDATYQGQVTSTADTLALPAGGPTWTSLGFASGGDITVSGSKNNNGDFTIAPGGISTDGYTLTLTDTSLTQEIDLHVTVGATYGASDAGNNVTAANVTVAGTLSAQSALINVPSESTRPVTFSITPSSTTPITVAGSGQGTDTLNVNYNTAGLAVTISETQTTTGTQTLSSGTITATGMRTVTFTNIAAVNITDAAGGARVTLNGNSTMANTMSLVGSGQGAGTVTLDNAPLSFSGLASLKYQGGISDTISVTPFATPEVSWALAVTVAGGSFASPASLTFNSVASMADTVTATSADAGVIGSPGLAAVTFSNVSTVTANANGTSDELTVNLPDGSAMDTANLASVSQTAADIQLGQTAADINTGLFDLDADTAYAGLTINGNEEGANTLDMVTTTTPSVGLPMPLTLNYTNFLSVVNAGTASTVNATTSGDTITVTNVSTTEVQVQATDVLHNVSTFYVTGGANNELLFNGLGDNDIINIPGDHPFGGGIYVYGNASFSDALNYDASDSPGAAVSVTPSTSTISETPASSVVAYGPVVYAGISTVNVIGDSSSPASLTYNSVASLGDTLTATGTNEGSIASAGLTAVNFSNVSTVNYSSTQVYTLTVNLSDPSLTPNTVTFPSDQTLQFTSLFDLVVVNSTLSDTVVVNGGKDLVTNATITPSFIYETNSADPLTSMVNTGTASTVSETASGSSIDVSSTGLVTVTDPLGNVSEFAITDQQLNLTDLGANDTIDIAGNNPFTNGIFVDGDASFTDVINYTASSDAAVTVNPSTATISQTGGGAVVYAGIQSVNLIASGSTSTLTVESLARGEALDFTQASAEAGSFTFVGTGVATDTAPLFSYTGFGYGVTVEGGTSLVQPSLSPSTPHGTSLNPPGLSLGKMTGTLATVTGYSYVNESVSATMTLTTGQYAGLVARYTGAGDQNLDLGFVVAGRKSYTAYIYRNVNGTWKSLFNHIYHRSVAANSTLTFDAVGSSLILSLDGNIIGCATDRVLASTAGSAGMRTSSGAVMSSFVTAPVMLQTASNPFSDNFTTSSASGSLSTYWINQIGAFQVNTSSGTATAFGSATTLDLATVNGISNANEAVSATITTLTTGQRVGLIARYGGSGLGNMYYGTIVAGSGHYTAHINRLVNGAFTSLFSKTYVGTATGKTLEFDVVGTALRLYLNNSIIAYANDRTLTTGSVGMVTFGRAVAVSNFNAVAITPPTASYPFSNAATGTSPITGLSNGQLNSYWNIQSGDFVDNAGTLTGQSSGLNLATVNGVSQTTENVSATITLTTGQYAGLVTRYAGPGVRNMYLGKIVAGSGTYRAYIYRIVHGVWRKLAASQTFSGSVTGAVLELSVSGRSLTLKLNSTTVATATAATHTSAGSVGILSSGGVTISSFSAD